MNSYEYSIKVGPNPLQKTGYLESGCPFDMGFCFMLKILGQKIFSVFIYNPRPTLVRRSGRPGNFFSSILAMTVLEDLSFLLGPKCSQVALYHRLPGRKGFANIPGVEGESASSA